MTIIFTPLRAAWANIAGSATLAASSEAAGMPVSRLQQQDVSRHFRTGAVTTVSIDFTYAANQSADLFCVLGTNLTAAGIVNVKLSATALGNVDVWESNPTSTPGTVDPLYEDAIVLASAVKSGWKFCRIVLTDTSLTYLEGGYAFFSTTMAFDTNPDFSVRRTVVDPSDKKYTRGGQTRVIYRVKYRKLDLNIPVITETQRWSLVEAMDLANGTSVPVMILFNPSSSNMGRDSVFGMIEESSPVAYLQTFDLTTGEHKYARPYSVRERL